MDARRAEADKWPRASSGVLGWYQLNLVFLGTLFGRLIGGPYSAAMKSFLDLRLFVSTPRALARALSAATVHSSDGFSRCALASAFAISRTTARFVPVGTVPPSSETSAVSAATLSDSPTMTNLVEGVFLPAADLLSARAALAGVALTGDALAGDALTGDALADAVGFDTDRARDADFLPAAGLLGDLLGAFDVEALAGDAVDVEESVSFFRGDALAGEAATFDCARDFDFDLAAAFFFGDADLALAGEADFFELLAFGDAAVFLPALAADAERRAFSADTWR
jgi:hypothetical protein